MDRLRETLIAVLEGYTGKAFNGYSYLTSSTDQRHYVVTSVGTVQKASALSIQVLSFN